MVPRHGMAADLLIGKHAMGLFTVLVCGLLCIFGALEFFEHRSRARDARVAQALEQLWTQELNRLSKVVRDS